MPDVIINGSEGRLEGRYHHNPDKHAPAAIILHPHPKQGGTMNNAVVYNLYKCFAKSGFSTLRFNFRGVGKSEGKFDSGVGELCDAATAMDWLQSHNPDASTFWIGGFSFGSWLSMQLLMRRPELEGFITVSPPVTMYDFNFLAPCPRSGLIIQGTRDSVVMEEDVALLAEKLNGQRRIKVEYQPIDGADHFYREHIKELSSCAMDYIQDHLSDIRRKGGVRPDKKRRQLPKTS